MSVIFSKQGFEDLLGNEKVGPSFGPSGHLVILKVQDLRRSSSTRSTGQHPVVQEFRNSNHQGRQTVFNMVGLLDSGDEFAF